MKRSLKNKNVPEISPKKRRSRKIVGSALFGTLLVGPSFSHAQDITKQYTTKNDSELKAIQHSQPDSTIIRGNVVDSLEENLDKDVSPEEIQKFMKDHKEELVKYINETNNNDKINETIYEELIKDEKIISIIQEMTKDSDVRKAVLNGDTSTIHEKLTVYLKNEYNPMRLNIVNNLIWALVGAYLGRKI